MCLATLSLFRKSLEFRTHGYDSSQVGIASMGHVQDSRYSIRWNKLPLSFFKHISRKGTLQVYAFVLILCMFLRYVLCISCEYCLAIS